MIGRSHRFKHGVDIVGEADVEMLHGPMMVLQ